MTDLKRHEKGIWRSIYIFAEIKEQWKPKEILEKKLLELNYSYAFNYYGEIKTERKDLNEKAHITFRIHFPDLEKYQGFLRFLGSEEGLFGKYIWEDHGYDEPLWVKRAYIVGTKLAKEILEATDHPDIPLDTNFLRLLFHGCFNNLHYNRKEEVEFYLTLFNSMLAYVYGLRTKKIT